MSLYEVFKKFIDFFITGSTISPEIVELFALAMTLGFVWIALLRPLYKLIRGRD